MASLSHTEVKINFTAMGTSFEVIGSGADFHVMNDVASYAHELESMWTRFRDSSELMQLNHKAGQFVPVSQETTFLVEHMRRGYFLTAGLFNAGVLLAMLQSEFTAPDSTYQPEKYDAKHMDSLWEKVEVQPHQVRLPVGLAIDAGGIGKGLAADLMAELGMKRGAQGIVVNAGGEVSVRGESPNPQGWSVGVENPFDSEDLLATAYLHAGGFATSAPSGWMSGDRSHIMDPRTGQSVKNDIAQATVLSARAVDSEILAKMCVLMPIEESLEKIDELGAAALIVDNDLNLYPSSFWSEFE